MADRAKLVAGNWKMNGLRADGLALARGLAERRREAGGAGPACEILVCPPTTLLAAVREILAGGDIALGGQDCHAAAKGAHTGDISAEMLADAGCSHVILGHSERRHGHGESDAAICAKLAAALRAGLVAVLCVGETRAEREAGKATEIVAAQLAGSMPDGVGADRLVVAYEPVWAIGTGLTATTDDIGAMHAAIRARIPAADAHPLWRLGQSGQRRPNPRPRRGRRGAGRRRQPRCRRFLGDRALLRLAAMRFDGKIALVTGGTSGIGRAAAFAFAREGAKVVVAGRREKEGNETVGAIRQRGGAAVFVRADVSVEAEVSALVRRAVDEHGRLDAAFNNAGTIALSPIVDETEAHYREVVDTNVKGVFACLKYEIREMLKTGGGAIVNTASLAGLVGARERSLYAASKHAVIGLTRSAALEAARHGIRVNAVCPAAITGAMDELFMSHFHLAKDELAAAVPLRRAGTPEDVAAAVLFLCSAEASFITGAVLAVDGGMSAQ